MSSLIGESAFTFSQQYWDFPGDGLPAKLYHRVFNLIHLPLLAQLLIKSLPSQRGKVSRKAHSESYSDHTWVIFWICGLFSSQILQLFWRFFFSFSAKDILQRMSSRWCVFFSGELCFLKWPEKETLITMQVAIKLHSLPPSVRPSVPPSLPHFLPSSFPCFLLLPRALI